MDYPRILLSSYSTALDVSGEVNSHYQLMQDLGRSVKPWGREGEEIVRMKGWRGKKEGRMRGEERIPAIVSGLTKLLSLSRRYNQHHKSCYYCVINSPPSFAHCASFAILPSSPP